MLGNGLENVTGVVSPFCKHGRSENRRTAFKPSDKSSEAVGEKADQFEIGVALAQQVSKAKLEQAVLSLSSFHTRHTASADLWQVTAWLVEQFQELGYDDVKLDPFMRNGLNLNNIICTKRGDSGEKGTIILCGHFDTIIASAPNNASLRSPGANDNATGIAVILEVARILATVPLQNPLKFVCFSGEEKGFWGSTAYAKETKAANLNLRFLLNLDQVGFPGTNRTVVVEYDHGNVSPDNDNESRILAETVTQISHERLNIPIDLAPIERSDYMPFEALGYTVIGLYESGSYQHQHTNRDTIEKVDFDYLVDMSKIALTAMFA
jgi:aminopeptidase YwaD